MTWMGLITIWTICITIVVIVLIKEFKNWK